MINNGITFCRVLKYVVYKPEIMTIRMCRYNMYNIQNVVVFPSDKLNKQNKKNNRSHCTEDEMHKTLFGISLM